MRERYGIKVIMHRATDAPYIDVRVDDGDEIQFGQQTLKVIHTPGHTQDAMCLLFKDRLFTGDTLLIGGCGRTDLPGGNAEAQYESLAKLKPLGDHIRVYPGHDYREAVSNLGDEKQNNARMLISSKEEFVHFMTSRKPPLPRKIQEALEWNRTPIQGTQRGMEREFKQSPVQDVTRVVPRLSLRDVLSRESSFDADESLPGTLPHLLMPIPCCLLPTCK